ncbi:MAG: hypothetical protein PHP62_06015 [Candidatus Moranbacteria bacterium]|nr:hypothetical protein [Candidatus Moranbacteria bacterium]
MKKFFVGCAKVIALTIGQIFFFSIAVQLVGSTSKPLPPEEMQKAGMGLFLACFINSLIIWPLVSRSRMKGIKFILALFLLVFGIQTFMAQIETLFFNSSLKIPLAEIAGFFKTGALAAALFSLFSALVLGRLKNISSHDEIGVELPTTSIEWTWKLSVLSVLYVILYMSFGYFVAWQSPAVREFYTGSTEISGFFSGTMRTLFVTNPWLGPFQILRALMWTGLTLIVVKMMKGKVWEVGLTNGLMLGIFFTSYLLLPNPYMPEPVRMAHLLETSTSTFIFGVAAVYLLNFRKKNL